MKYCKLFKIKLKYSFLCLINELPWKVLLLIKKIITYGDKELFLMNLITYSTLKRVFFMISTHLTRASKFSAAPCFLTGIMGQRGKRPV